MAGPGARARAILYLIFTAIAMIMGVTSGEGGGGGLGVSGRDMRINVSEWRRFMDEENRRSVAFNPATPQDVIKRVLEPDPEPPQYHYMEKDELGLYRDEGYGPGHWRYEYNVKRIAKLGKKLPPYGTKEFNNAYEKLQGYRLGRRDGFLDEPESDPGEEEKLDKLLDDMMKPPKELIALDRAMENISQTRIAQAAAFRTRTQKILEQDEALPKGPHLMPAKSALRKIAANPSPVPKPVLDAVSATATDPRTYLTKSLARKALGVESSLLPKGGVRGVLDGRNTGNFDIFSIFSKTNASYVMEAWKRRWRQNQRKSRMASRELNTEFTLLNDSQIEEQARKEAYREIRKFYMHSRSASGQNPAEDLIREYYTMKRDEEEYDQHMDALFGGNAREYRRQMEVNGTFRHMEYVKMKQRIRKQSKLDKLVPPELRERVREFATKQAEIERAIRETNFDKVPCIRIPRMHKIPIGTFGKVRYSRSINMYQALLRPSGNEIDEYFTIGFFNTTKQAREAIIVHRYLNPDGIDLMSGNGLEDPISARRRALLLLSGAKSNPDKVLKDFLKEKNKFCPPEFQDHTDTRSKDTKKDSMADFLIPKEKLRDIRREYKKANKHATGRSESVITPTHLKSEEEDIHKGFEGVEYSSRLRKWKATATLPDGTKIYLGEFDRYQEAVEAVKEGTRPRHPGFEIQLAEQKRQERLMDRHGITKPLRQFDDLAHEAIKDQVLREKYGKFRKNSEVSQENSENGSRTKVGSTRVLGERLTESEVEDSINSDVTHATLEKQKRYMRHRLRKSWRENGGDMIGKDLRENAWKRLKYEENPYAEKMAMKDIEEDRLSSRRKAAERLRQVGINSVKKEDRQGVRDLLKELDNLHSQDKEDGTERIGKHSQHSNRYKPESYEPVYLPESDIMDSECSPTG
ncbi:hypothetical protein AAMO2058_000303400 [Amorphochlora amoebiformis]